MTAIDSRRWDAVRHRDAAATFVFGVRTTRVACRPGCPARTPRPENVEFFENFAAAREAGFRACKRCAPDDRTAYADRERLVAKACALLDGGETPALADVAAAVGISRFHFQRIFRDVLGVTPGEYRRARRDARFRESLAQGRSVTQAMADAGYGSPSRAYEANAVGMPPSRFRAGARGERIAYTIAQTSLGRVLVARAGGGVCAIELGDDDAAVLASLQRDFPQALLERDDATLAEPLQSVVAMVDRGSDMAAEIDLEMRGTAFQRRVWKALRAIPAGERRTYAELASAVGSPSGARAVAAACASNKLAVAVPCHRVVGSDGALRGYKWGVDRKAALLRKERGTTGES